MFARSAKIMEPNHTLTIIVTGCKEVANEPLNVKNEQLERKVKEAHKELAEAEILFCRLSYLQHPPVRWHVEPRGNICVLVDSDVLVCSPLQGLKKWENCNAVAGVLAHESPYELDEWMKIFNHFGIEYNDPIYQTTDTEKACPFYVNYGVLIVDSCLMPKIREKIGPNIEKVMEMEERKHTFTSSGHSPNFFVGQIALTVTLAELPIKKQTLPVRYNYPDYPHYDEKFPEELNQILFFHHLKFKNSYDVPAFCKSITPKQKEKIKHIFQINKSIL